MPPPHGESAEEARVLRDPSPVRSPFGNHQRRHHGTGWPPDLAGESWCESNLHVQVPEEALDVDDDRLDLDHKERLPPRIVGKKVHPSALAIPIEADFWSRLPPVTGETPEEDLEDGRVISVAGASQIRRWSGIPTQMEPHGCGHAPRGPDRGPLGVTRLQQSNGARAHRGAAGQITLAPTLRVAQRADRRAQELVVHRGIVHGDLYRRVIAR